ncbi:MAG: hypothetical protein EZS28_020000 [Streblomastix strix]|uniref:Uncharacterized protein n=1 Tax=Streblomastix strix TaxID=222440 RepID=A0A5J4VQ99_9EUKA|nr:MAG: hypothetical protein EZS28_020000 [Streblomastix strix]
MLQEEIFPETLEVKKKKQRSSSGIKVKKKFDPKTGLVSPPSLAFLAQIQNQKDGDKIKKMRKISDTNSMYPEVKLTKIIPEKRKHDENQNKEEDVEDLEEDSVQTEKKKRRRKRRRLDESQDDEDVEISESEQKTQKTQKQSEGKSKKNIIDFDFDDYFADPESAIPEVTTQLVISAMNSPSNEVESSLHILTPSKTKKKLIDPLIGEIKEGEDNQLNIVKDGTEEKKFNDKTSNKINQQSNLKKNLNTQRKQQSLYRTLLSPFSIKSIYYTNTEQSSENEEQLSEWDQIV